MKEQIQQMIYNLNEKVGVHWTNEDKLKFAELIFRECQYAILSKYDLPAHERKLYNNVLKEHFGVE